MNHTVFESARGIILRGGPDNPHVADGDLVTVETNCPFRERTARVRVALADSFTRLGHLRGMEGTHDWLLEWTSDPVDHGRARIAFGVEVFL